jgi:hypothetical protein
MPFGNVNFSQREKFTREISSLSVGFADGTVPVHRSIVPKGILLILFKS